jgi:hypothetical protein
LLYLLHKLTIDVSIIWLMECSHIFIDCHDPMQVTTKRLEPAPSCLALLMVDKQIYSEAVTLFYGMNEFIFKDLEHLLAVVRKIGVKRAHAIKSIMFRFKSYKAKGSLLELAPFVSKLENLKLFIDHEDCQIYVRSLQHCVNVRLLADTFTNLKSLTLYGRDQIVKEDKTFAKVNINDPRASGPWLREKMLRPSETKTEDVKNAEKEKNVNDKEVHEEGITFGKVLANAISSGLRQRIMSDPNRVAKGRKQPSRGRKRK